MHAQLFLPVTLQLHSMVSVRELQRIKQLVEHEVDTITVELFTDDV